MYLKKSLKDKCTIINPNEQENSKDKSSIETEKKGIKILKIENEETDSNLESKGNNNPELSKNSKKKINWADEVEKKDSKKIYVVYN
ncbi:hypothetical protein ACMBCN_01650 [Candidatus Liberibacter asiaticus]|nr:hypothetical protein [Candidatus Liberibacter asiaticus]